MENNLQKLSNNGSNISIHHVKAHIDIKGNELADKAAISTSVVKVKSSYNLIPVSIIKRSPFGSKQTMGTAASIIRIKHQNQTSMNSSPQQTILSKPTSRNSPLQQCRASSQDTDRLKLTWMIQFDSRQPLHMRTEYTDWLASNLSLWSTAPNAYRSG